MFLAQIHKLFCDTLIPSPQRGSPRKPPLRLLRGIPPPGGRVDTPGGAGLQATALTHSPCSTSASTLLEATSMMRIFLPGARGTGRLSREHKHLAPGDAFSMAGPCTPLRGRVTPMPHSPLATGYGREVARSKLQYN